MSEYVKKKKKRMIQMTARGPVRTDTAVLIVATLPRCQCVRGDGTTSTYKLLNTVTGIARVALLVSMMCAHLNYTSVHLHKVWTIVIIIHW
jgi:hypothetical protein